MMGKVVMVKILYTAFLIVLFSGTTFADTPVLFSESFECTGPQTYVRESVSQMLTEIGDFNVRVGAVGDLIDNIERYQQSSYLFKVFQDDLLMQYNALQSMWGDIAQQEERLYQECPWAQEAAATMPFAVLNEDIRLLKKEMSAARGVLSKIAANVCNITSMSVEK